MLKELSVQAIFQKVKTIQECSLDLDSSLNDMALNTFYSKAISVVTSGLHIILNVFVKLIFFDVANK